MNATELLDRLPRWTAHSRIPTLESAGLSWRDEPVMAEWQGAYSGRRSVLLVGDKRFHRLRLEARNEARAIVRTGLRDWIEYVESAGTRVW